MTSSAAHTTVYRVTGMSCGHCETAVGAEVQMIPGVTGFDVSAADGSLIVTSSEPLDDALVVAAVDEAGYAAERIEAR